jgi:hypothetical protein
MIDPEGATLSYGYGSAGAEDLWTVMVEHPDSLLVTRTPFAHWYNPPDSRLRAYVAANFQLHAIGGLLFHVRHGFPSGSGQQWLTAPVRASLSSGTMPPSHLWQLRTFPSASHRLEGDR